MTYMDHSGMTHSETRTPRQIKELSKVIGPRPAQNQEGLASPTSALGTHDDQSFHHSQGIKDTCCFHQCQSKSLVTKRRVIPLRRSQIMEEMISRKPLRHEPRITKTQDSTI